MSTSVKKAEEAAYNGEGQDFDTQLCTHLQNEFLSSSPRIPVEEEIASNANIEAEGETENDDIESHSTSQVIIRVEPTLPAEEEARNKDFIQQARNLQVPIDGVDDDSSSWKNPLQFRRDAQGKLRPINTEGREFHRQVIGFDEKYRKAIKEMEDFSPKSSLSPTQANSESVYHAYHLSIFANQLSSTDDGVVDKDADDNHTQKGLGLTKQHHSAVTDSTAHTYGENDTGHVNLCLTAPENQMSDQGTSQDASFNPPAQEESQPSYEPRTPAPVNPFLQKGSVLKGHEMFGATQPSSIGRHIASPTSSRPSPDVYSGSSPEKALATSPLERHGEEISMLQSSVRTMLRSKSTESHQRFESPPITSSRSFGYTRSRHEPRDTYVSIKESQERRQKESSTSESEIESESDTEARIPRERQRREREAKVHRQLAQVTSSRPGSGISGDVEVPASGGRRRSVEEDYIAQCKGTDARDTQQEDIVIDSQAIVEEAEAIDLPDVIVTTRRASQVETRDITLPKSSPRLPSRWPSVEPHRVPDLCTSSQTQEVSSPLKNPSELSQPSLPLQEVSTNRNDLKTPVVSKPAHVLSDGADATIPNTILETSPLGGDRIRLMGEVTSLSFADNVYDDAVVDEAPGFTQDIEFDRAINSRFSPTPPPKSRTKGFPSFEPPDAGGNLSTITSEALAPRVYINDNDATDDVALDEPQKDSEDDKEKRLDGPQRQSQAASIDENHEAVIAPQIVDQVVPVGAIETPCQEDTPRQALDRPQRAPKAVPKPPKEPIAKRGGLRTKGELKGPSKALRRSDETTTSKSQLRSSRSAKPISSTNANSARSSKHVSDVSSILSTPLSSLGSTPALESTPVPSTRSSTRKKDGTRSEAKNTTPAPVPAPKTHKAATQGAYSKEGLPFVPLPRQQSTRRSIIQGQEIGGQTPASAPPTRSSKRKAVVLDDEEASTRASKRQSISHLVRESSDDPLALPSATLDGISRSKKSNSLFANMSFAVSYVKQGQEKSQVTGLITEHGGQILEDGFEKLFESASLLRSRTSDENAELTPVAAAKSIGFVALIADEHSRKAKYMQALALGLPCISGRWILTCDVKGEVVDWIPYLLCAGQSAFLGNAIRSRTLARYSANEARFPDTLLSREKLLDGRSVLLVTAKGKEETRKAYAFLTRAMGPVRIDQVADHVQARKKLLDDESWDLLYVDKNELAAEAAIFGSSSTKASGSKKRKRGPAAVEEDMGLRPKKIRIITDEVIIQSLILGQLLED
ncbi:rad9 [Hyphodiscus hymeniophilus]|uniref:Rad9 n=1 Tax=Hyphodiscus hymeniophilus TaxID=353542 RepID=A0A9P7AU66_9HELO|nr:rad9 [Hyphodiscus hymeniophilus]